MTASTATFTGVEILGAIARATPLPAYVEQTGGGVATVFIGDYREVPDPIGHAYRLAVGPGTFDWSDARASTFYAEDLSIGPDDWGERPSIQVTTLDELTAAVRELLAEPDWRNA